jgi:hypothetical protein
MVVDYSVTDSRNWDFFLQGTASPAHYTRAAPTLRVRKLSDELETLVLTASHSLGRATIVISIASRPLARLFQPSVRSGERHRDREHD